MHQTLRSVILVCFLLSFLEAKAQNFPRSDGSEYPAIILADPREGNIRLRWAPTAFEWWEAGNASGYSLYRSEAGTPGSLVLLGEDFMPISLPDWRAITDTLEPALMYAGALYSEDLLDPSVPQELNDESSYLQSIAEYRYGLSLFSADQYYDIALAAGLAYEDKTAKRDKVYVYEIRINGVLPEGNDAYPTVTVNSNSRSVLPAPPKLSGSWSNGSVELSFDQSASSFFYSSYNIERSVAGSSWNRINELPIVFFETR
ncbi:MAG: hypothetical protein AAFY36_08965 [Bacteroidota bacterium]